jgi:tRNA(fMet)-specific endonuclease VapC
MIADHDLWIAAHALVQQATLVTNNERDFARIPDLRIENWAK